jgi:hypothetical protein
MKEVLSKSASRKALFKEFCKLELPPNPVVTHWATGIETASYYFANYEIVKRFIKTKLKATSKAVQTLIDLVDNQKLEDEIFYVNDFAFLPKIIKGLEKQGLKKSEQMDLLNEAKSQLKDEVLIKLNNSLAKNTDIHSFIENNDFTFRKKTIYAPLISVDVERSFSLYKNILSDRRQCLKTENIEKYNVIEFNKCVFEELIEI